MAKSILDKLPEAKKDVLLKDFTTYKIGGKARYFFVAKSKEDLISALKVAKEFKLPVFILAGGSNLLISDKGFKGLVIKIDIQELRAEGNVFYAGAGTSLSKAAHFSSLQGLSGLEWSAGIPGTVGGAIFGRAQAFGETISDCIKSVEAVSIKTSEVKSFSKEECRFSLKNSIFKKYGKWIIVSAVFELKNASVEDSKAKIDKFIEYRKKCHPVDFPSAGSTFVNPEIKIKNKALLKKFPDLAEMNTRDAIPAAYLIEKCGLKGKKIGQAAISEKHANFIVNLGNAKANDVLRLIKLVQKKVKKTFGVSLLPEVRFVGF